MYKDRSDEDKKKAFLILGGMGLLGVIALSKNSPALPAGVTPATPGVQTPIAPTSIVRFDEVAITGSSSDYINFDMIDFVGGMSFHKAGSVRTQQPFNEFRMVLHTWNIAALPPGDVWALDLAAVTVAGPASLGPVLQLDSTNTPAVFEKVIDTGWVSIVGKPLPAGSEVSIIRAHSITGVYSLNGRVEVFMR